MDILFTAISIFYAFRSLQIAYKVIGDWTNLRKPSLTPKNKQLAGQASFFLAVPVGVLIHEAAHAFFVLLFGGEVQQFGYRVFWGFVIPDRAFAAPENWLIALAGTLGSLLFGIIIWLVFRNNRSQTFQYFGLRAFHYQIFFSLIYYPVFTLMGFYGDWRTIYNFSSTPILSGATAVIHAGILLLFWQAERRGFFEMGAFSSTVSQEKVTELEEMAARNPYDSQLQLQLIDTYRQAGLTQKSSQLLQKFLKDNPNSAEGQLQQAVLQSTGKAQIPANAKESALKAINLGLNNPQAVAAAHQIAGRYDLDRNKLDSALDHYSRAIGALQSTDNPDLLISLFYHRALTQRRKEQYQFAYQDIQQALQLARQSNSEGSIKFLNEELETIKSHAGRPLDQFTIPPEKFEQPTKDE